VDPAFALRSFLLVLCWGVGVSTDAEPRQQRAQDRIEVIIAVDHLIAERSQVEMGSKGLGDDRSLGLTVFSLVASLDQIPGGDGASGIRLENAGGAGPISARASETLEEANGAQRNHADPIGRDAQRLLPCLLLHEAVGVAKLEGARLSGRHRMSTVVRSDRRNEVIRPAEWCINPDGVAPGRHGDDEIVVDARPQLNNSTRLQQGG